MFYVSISKVALDKAVEHAKSGGQEEVVGVLIGRVVGQTVVVEDAITGKIESTATRAILPPETIAKIADDIIKQRIQGNIVGWYHSHPGYGIFMSNVDVATQTKLQQFSRYVTALIVDPLSDEVGFFTLDTSGAPISIPSERVRIFAEGEEPVTPEFEIPIERPEVPVEIPSPIIVPRGMGQRLVVVLLLVVIALGFLGGLIFHDFLIQAKVEYVTVSVIAERIPVTTYSIMTVTLTRNVTSSIAFTTTITSKAVFTTTEAEMTRTVTFTTTETKTYSTVISTTTVFATVTTSTFTSTSTYASTTTLWTTATRSKAGITLASALNQPGTLAETLFCSVIVAGLLLFRRRSLSVCRPVKSI